MNIRQERVDTKLIFYLEGELIAKEKISFIATVMESIEKEQGIDILAMETGNISYLDSSGLGSLLDLKEKLSQKGIDLVLVNIPEYMGKLLKITHLDNTFTAYGNIDQLLGTQKDADEIQQGRIEIPSELEQVQHVSRRLISVLQKYHLPENVLMDMRLAIEEAAINCIRHGNEFSSGKEVLVEYAADKNGIQIRMIDEGDGFDYENTEGKGLKLIKHIMDKVEFDRDGAEIIMYKKF